MHIESNLGSNKIWGKINVQTKLRIQGHRKSLSVLGLMQGKALRSKIFSNNFGIVLSPEKLEFRSSKIQSLDPFPSFDPIC